MRILQFHRSLSAGGIEAMVCGLCNEMAKSEDVTVCTIFSPDENDVFYRRLSSGVKKETIGKHGGRISLRDLFDIYLFMKEGKYDVVQMHGFFYYYILSIFLLHRRTRFFYTIHSQALQENNPWDLRLLKIKKWCFKRGWVHPITISPASQKSFSELYSCPSRMIRNGSIRPEINNTDDLLSKYRVSENTKVFIHPGRISPEKNQVVLCRVFNRLILEGEDVALVIAGPVHWANIFEEMKTFFSERISYIGERSDIPALMHCSDGLCISSLYEGLPIVLLEALSVGCIPICTPVGGIVNVVTNGVNGVLSDSSDEEAYYRAMKSFLALPKSKFSEMKSNCKESFEDYDISRTAKEYLEYYNDIISGCKKD